MLVWATEFPLAKGGCEDVLSVAKGTLVTSPHHPWEITSFGEDPVGELKQIELAGEKVIVGQIETGGLSTAGLEHQWVEDGEREWRTEVVACEQHGGIVAAVRLDCNLLRPGPRLPVPKKPYVVRRLLEDLGGGDDAGFTVGDAPHRLEEWAVEGAAKLVTGTAGVRLPVVYVSVGRFREPFVDVDELARWLGGMAHVVVEPSRYFSFALARNAGRMNAYGGAVSIYWPDGAAAQDRFLPSSFATANAMQSAIAARVRTAMTHIRPASNCTFEYLRELVSRRRIEHLREAGSTAVEDYIEAFDAELKAKDERLASLDREVGRLKAELRRYDNSDRQEGGILTSGAEREFYPGEVRDAVIHTLLHGRNALLPDGRRAHLISDLLEVNQASSAERDVEGEIKDAFSESGDLGGEQRRVLEDLGFSVEEAGKHWKAIYQGDDRYAFTISKTSSDHRAGKNLASTILKKLFK